MRRIYLVRHGQSVSNAGGEAQLNAQIELTDLGQEQAGEVAEWLWDNLGHDIDSIQVSKFIRTQQTAEPLAKMTQITPQVIEGLHEFDYLSYEAIKGTTLDTRRQMADAYWVEMQPKDHHGEDAESFEQFYNRVAQVMAHFQSLPNGNHVVFTHGLWISMLIWQILGQPHQSNKHMRKFRQFELSIRAKNCEVFCLTLPDSGVNDSVTASAITPAITKVRTRPFTDAINADGS